jgi:hypothetical protein
MPLFQRKQSKVDATRHWVGDIRFPLQLDLSRHSLSAVRIGSPIDGLMRLGPAEDPEMAEDEVYRYYSRGVEVTAEDGFVIGYRIIWRPDEGFQPFPGQCFFRGERVELSPTTSEAELSAIAGAPYWRDEDQHEILAFYEFDRIEWQIELTTDGRLSQWSIVTPPSMSDREQREAYGVTKPRPPPGLGRIRPRSANALLYDNEEKNSHS